MTLYKITALLILTLSIIACSQTPRKSNSQVELAKLEFQQKNYPATLALLEPEAAKGDPDAQYSLGYMYFYGIGVAQNVIKGRELIQAAAQRNHRKALKAIDIMAQHEQSNASFPPAGSVRIEEK